jgi:hypothetical protein
MDIFDLMEPSYGEILSSVNFLQKEVENLDQDSLIDEISGIQHNIDGDEAKKIQNLIFKAHADSELSEEEMSFLRNVYVIYYCQFAYIVDEKDDDGEV